MTNTLAAIGYKNDVELRYARKDNLIRVKIQNMVNHEIRDVIVGMFFRLSKADRDDLLQELATYNDPSISTYLGVVASAILADDGQKRNGMTVYQVESIRNADSPGRRP